VRPLRVRSSANFARDKVLGFFDETFVNDARFLGLFRGERRRRLEGTSYARVAQLAAIERSALIV
jgi:hypothetical protein